MAAFLADLAYSAGKIETRKELDMDSVDLPVDESVSDSDTDPESSTDTQD